MSSSGNSHKVSTSPHSWGLKRKYLGKANWTCVIPPVCTVYFLFILKWLWSWDGIFSTEGNKPPLPSTTILHLPSSLITIGSYRDDLEQKIRKWCFIIMIMTPLQSKHCRVVILCCVEPKPRQSVLTPSEDDSSHHSLFHSWNSQINHNQSTHWLYVSI